MVICDTESEEGNKADEKQHVEIDDSKEMLDLSCTKAALGRNYNLQFNTR